MHIGSSQDKPCGRSREGAQVLYFNFVKRSHDEKGEGGLLSTSARTSRLMCMRVCMCAYVCNTRIYVRAEGRRGRSLGRNKKFKSSPEIRIARDRWAFGVCVWGKVCSFSFAVPHSSATVWDSFLKHACVCACVRVSRVCLFCALLLSFSLPPRSARGRVDQFKAVCWRYLESAAEFLKF